jgi:hypothetical protein
VVLVQPQASLGLALHTLVVVEAVVALVLVVLLEARAVVVLVEMQTQRELLAQQI